MKKYRVKNVTPKKDGRRIYPPFETGKDDHHYDEELEAHVGNGHYLDPGEWVVVELDAQQVASLSVSGDLEVTEV